jgi:hypothetical protein
MLQNEALLLQRHALKAEIQLLRPFQGYTEF